MSSCGLSDKHCAFLLIDINKCQQFLLRFTLKTLTYIFSGKYIINIPWEFIISSLGSLFSHRVTLSWQYSDLDVPNHLSFAHQSSWMLEKSTQPGTLMSLKTVNNLDPLSQPTSYNHVLCSQLLPTFFSWIWFLTDPISTPSSSRDSCLILHRENGSH